MDVDRGDRLGVRECEAIDEDQLRVISIGCVQDLDAVGAGRRIVVESVDESMYPVDFQRCQMEERGRPDLQIIMLRGQTAILVRASYLRGVVLQSIG